MHPVQELQGKAGSKKCMDAGMHHEQHAPKMIQAPSKLHMLCNSVHRREYERGRVWSKERCFPWQGKCEARMQAEATAPAWEDKQGQRGGHCQLPEPCRPPKKKGG
eukprot:1155224-Pelagomonas_calceolata.AAC.12